MGLSTVVDKMQSLKQSVKKPIVALRESVQSAYTKAYVGSPERVDEFYDYIKVYQPSKHNDLCMMSITADINRFAMLPDKHTFYSVHKLERHFDRMIAARKQEGVNGDMAIQILSGHNLSFMAKYRRYKSRAALKEMKRDAKRHKALNINRLTQMPSSSRSSGSSGSSVVSPVSKPDEPNQVDESKEDKELAKITRQIKDVSVTCEMTKTETETETESIVETAAPTAVAKIEPLILPMREEDPVAIFNTRAKLTQNKLRGAHAKKHETNLKKFKLAKSYVPSKKVEVQKVPKKIEESGVTSNDLINDALQNLNLDDDKDKKVPEDYDHCEDSDDGSDIEELEKIEEKDVDALEYEMI